MLVWVGRRGEREDTVRDESDVLAPDDWEVGVFAAAAEANVDFFHVFVAAQELFLLVAKGGACFDEVDGFNACRQGLEIADGLDVSAPCRRGYT